MHPVIFKVGPLCIYSYGVMFALAFLSATYLAGRNSVKFGLPQQFISDLFIVLVVSGIIGARLLYVASNLNEFVDRPFEIFMFWRGGLVFYGGLALAVITGALFIRKRGYHYYRVADCVAPYLALAHAIGRIGCLLNGCCYGRPTDSWLGIIEKSRGAAVHPTQIYSSLGLLSIFIMLRIMQGRRHREGNIFLAYCALYGLLRLTVEFFRGDPSDIMLGLRVPQVLSLVLICAAITLYARRKD